MKTTKAIGEYAEQLATLYRILQTAAVAMEAVDALPDEVKDGVLEPHLVKLIGEARTVCGEATLRMIAYGEDLAPTPSYSFTKPPYHVQEREEPRELDVSEQWWRVLYDVKCDRAIRRLREQIPLPVPMEVIVTAVLRTWDECSGEDRVDMLLDAMGIDKDAMQYHTLFKDTEEQIDEPEDEVLFEIVDGKPRPVVWRTDRRADGVRYITSGQCRERYGGSEESYRDEWVRFFEDGPDKGKVTA